MSERHHISDSDFGRYHNEAMTEPETGMIEEHLLWCFHCQEREEETLHSVREKGLAHMDHISIDDLELYHSGSMTDRLVIAGIEQHISECSECADRLHRTEFHQGRIQ